MSFKYEYITKPEPFNSQKMHLLAFGPLSLQTKMTNFPTLSEIILTSTSPILYT